MAPCPLRNAGAIARLAGVVAVVVLVASCATTPKYGPDSPVTTVILPVERLQYAPLVPKLPITVGIYYSKEFREAVATAGGYDSPRYRYEVGAAAVALFDQIAASLFSRTIDLSSPPSPASNAAGVDLVLVARFAPDYQRFELDVVAPDGSTVASITSIFRYALGAHVTGVGWVLPHTVNSAEVAIGLLKLNDRMGDLSTSLILSPDVTRWAEARGFTWQWPTVAPPAISPTPPVGVTIFFCPGTRNCSATEETVAVTEALRKLDPAIRSIQPEDLRRALYPWLGNEYPTKEQAAEWLRRPAVVARAVEAGVRYLVLADELAVGTEQHGGVFCGGVPVGGCFGLAWWTRNDSARLRVFDFAAAADAGEVNHRNEDITWVMPAVGLPLPIPNLLGGESMPDAIAKQLLPLVRPPK
jgi:hypothetical protein